MTRHPAALLRGNRCDRSCGWVSSTPERAAEAWENAHLGKTGYKLFRIRAWLLHGGTVTRDDLRLLMYLGETHQEMALLRDKVPALLGDAWTPWPLAASRRAREAASGRNYCTEKPNKPLPTCVCFS
jgi:hypothetical protein